MCLKTKKQIPPKVKKCVTEVRCYEVSVLFSVQRLVKKPRYNNKNVINTVGKFK